MNLTSDYEGGRRAFLGNVTRGLGGVARASMSDSPVWNARGC